MLELYLFINPLGSTCYHAEQNILKLVELSKSKIKFKFVPLLNINSISSIMSSYGIDACDLKNEIRFPKSCFVQQSITKQRCFRELNADINS